MTTENEQAQKTAGATAEQSPPADLAGLMAGKEDELKQATARIAELEKTVASNAASLKLAVSSYKSLVLRSNPGVLAELITGETIEEIDHSVAAAKELVSKVRSDVESQISAARVPAGAPTRTSSGPSTLSPREKIHQALVGKH
jgi:hypothetical protein